MAFSTNFNFTFPGQLNTEIFLKPSEDTPAISDLAIVDQNIFFKKQYNTLNQISNIEEPYESCGASYDSLTAAINNVTLEVKPFQIRKSWCLDEFVQLGIVSNHLAEAWVKPGVDQFDPTGTQIASIMENLVLDAQRRDAFRRISFGDQASASASYNQIDGIWTRLIDTSGGSNYCVRRATGTSLGTADLSAGEALSVLEAVYAQSSNLLKAVPIGKKKFFVTLSIWDNYYNSLIGTGAVTEQAFTNTQNGLVTLKYKGIDVVPVPYWDTLLQESTNPLNATTRHLVLYTTKENHRVGVQRGADLNKIEGQYDWLNEKFYIKGNMMYGYQYLHCDFQTIAY